MKGDKDFFRLQREREKLKMVNTNNSECDHCSYPMWQYISHGMAKTHGGLSATWHAKAMGDDDGVSLSLQMAVPPCKLVSYSRIFLFLLLLRPQIPHSPWAPAVP